MKALVVYYSVTNGNTEKLAKQAAEALNAELCRIETAVPYTGTREEMTVTARDQIYAGELPELKPLTVSLADFDTVVIGTPTWWYTAAPAVRAFMRSCELSGKRVHLFQTHGGQPGSALRDLRLLCKGEVASEFSAAFDTDGGAEQVTPQTEIDAWIRSLAD